MTRLQLSKKPIRRGGKFAEVPTDYELDEAWPEIMRRFPNFENLRVSKNAYVRHCQTLGGEPTSDQLLDFAGLWIDDCSFDENEIAEAKAISRDEARAWAYLLLKKGYIRWCKDLQAFVGNFTDSIEEDWRA